MAELLISEDALENPETAGLLPIQKEVDSKLVACEYMFEISSAKQIHWDKNDGGDGLKCQFATTFHGNRLYCDELFFYVPPQSRRIAQLVKILGLTIKGIKEEDFIGMFFWATIRHEQYPSSRETNSDGTPLILTKNTINQFLRRATVEEVTGASGAEQEPDKEPF
jgi:hypothetical protein